MELKRRTLVERLEDRRVLAASLGWDGPGAGSAALTYHIANTPDSLGQQEAEAAIKTALDAWASVADITFTQVDQPGLRDSLDISFGRIDGAGGTLAQAYFPDDVNSARLAGDIQFDIAEAWEVGNQLGGQAFDLVSVAVHEIGHALGLDHSSAGDSSLAPTISPNASFGGLAASDSAAILQLYAPAIGNLTENPQDDSLDEPGVGEDEIVPADPAVPEVVVQPQPQPQWPWQRFRNWSFNTRIHRTFFIHLGAPTNGLQNFVTPTDTRGGADSPQSEGTLTETHVSANRWTQHERFDADASDGTAEQAMPNSQPQAFRPLGLFRFARGLFRFGR